MPIAAQATTPRNETLRSLLFLIALSAGLSCSSSPPAPAGIVDGALAPCPVSPNCVSSEATDETHAIAPIQLQGDPQRSWQTLVATVESTPGVEVVIQRPDYLYVVATTPIMRFVDNFELWLRPGGRVTVRSASRIGWGDLGANRDRVEALRSKLVAAGVATPSDEGP